LVPRLGAAPSGVTYPTARLDLKKLTELGVVKKLDTIDVITYYCPAIYAVTFEDVEVANRGVKVDRSLGGSQNPEVSPIIGYRRVSA
jgi:hypothetical protein